MEGSTKSSLILGVSTFLGLAVLGYMLGSSAIRFKEYERTVTVKGLAEKEVPANVAVWPIHFSAASNDLTALYAKLESDTRQVVDFLQARGFDESEITAAAPAITDKLANEEKFANDSNSRLGKIKSANQGQFTVSDRDSNTPYIKNVRVVSTVEYYLSD